jgi:uncharacterized protein (TIGR02145 family)
MKTTFKISLVLIISIFLNSQVIGQINGKLIGKQIWTTSNLNVTKFSNGDLIPEAKNAKEWEEFVKNKQAAWCYLNYNAANGLKYGKLYNWYAIKDPRGLNPKGWHIPTKQELDDLIGYGASALKSTIGWDSYSQTYPVEDSRGILVGYRDRTWSGNGTNKIGFSGLPGGHISGDGDFDKSSTGWWSSTDIDPKILYFNGFETWGYSYIIKLIQNENPIVKGEIRGIISYTDGSSMPLGVKELEISTEYDIIVLSDIENNGAFKFKNIPTGKYFFGVKHDQRTKRTRIPFSYNELTGLQLDTDQSWVLYLTPDYKESGVKELEINRGYYVRCVRDEIPIKQNIK